MDRSVPPQNGLSVVVVGAGPAGLSCAHYLARLGYQVDIVDKAKKPGGMLSHAVPVFRLAEDAVRREIDGLALPSMRFGFGRTLGRDFSVSDLGGRSDAVFLAPGVGAGQRPRISGMEKSEGIDVLAFLHACREEEKTRTGGRVLVIGGGSVAANAALSARHFGAREVTLVCLEGADEMPCLKSQREEMKHRGVRIENHWGPGELASAPGCASYAARPCTVRAGSSIRPSTKGRPWRLTSTGGSGCGPDYGILLGCLSGRGVRKGGIS